MIGMMYIHIYNNNIKNNNTKNYSKWYIQHTCAKHPNKNVFFLGFNVLQSLTQTQHIRIHMLLHIAPMMLDSIQ